MKKAKLLIFLMVLIVVAVLVLGGVLGASFRRRGGGAPKTGATGSGASAQAIQEIARYEYSKTYNGAGFSFKYPAGFKISELPAADSVGGRTILVQNQAEKVGAQIYITPTEETSNILTTTDIADSLPDLAVRESQGVTIGNPVAGAGQSGKGVAFLSDNPAFGGASREVWFVWKGHLYQISTYAELDPFLKGVFGTWQFR